MVIIYPPQYIRCVIDKTAQFVAKGGPEFEQRVLREQNPQKFAFLRPNNPYRRYYDLKIKEFKTNEPKKEEIEGRSRPTTVALCGPSAAGAGPRGATKGAVAALRQAPRRQDILSGMQHIEPGAYLTCPLVEEEEAARQEEMMLQAKWDDDESSSSCYRSCDH